MATNIEVPYKRGDIIWRPTWKTAFWLVLEDGGSRSPTPMVGINGERVEFRRFDTLYMGLGVGNDAAGIIGNIRDLDFSGKSIEDVYDYLELCRETGNYEFS